MITQSVWVVEPLALGPTSSLTDAPGVGWWLRDWTPIPVPPHNDLLLIKPLQAIPAAKPRIEIDRLTYCPLPTPGRHVGSIALPSASDDEVPAGVDDLGPQPEPQVRARPAARDELSRNAASLIRDAEKRRWRVEATYARGSALTTEMVEDVSAPLTPTGRKARKASTAWKVIESVAVRLLSPWGDRAVLLFENGSCTNAWVAPAGASGFSLAGYKTARSFLFGPWEAGMAYVPQWKRDKIEDRKRIAQKGTCTGCGADVFFGIDQSGGEKLATVDAEPLTDEFALLTEVAYDLRGWGVYTALPGPGGFELHRRDGFTIGCRRYPVHAAHRCGAHGQARVDTRSAA